MEKLFEINVSGTSYYFGDLTTSSALSAHVSDTSIHQTSGEVEDMLTAYTYDKATIDEKVASGGTFDPANYYDKSETDVLLDEKLDISTFNVYSGVVASEMVNKAENSDLEALEGTFSAFSATVAAEIQELEASGMTSGAVQDMLTAYTYDKATIDANDAQKLDITAFSAYSGTVASELSGKATESDLNALESTFSAFSATIETVITSGGGVVSSSDCQTMIDNSISGKTNESDFSAHTANTTVHITADERTAWDAKPNVWIGTQSQWAAISGSSENGTIYLVY